MKEVLFNYLTLSLSLVVFISLLIIFYAIIAIKKEPNNKKKIIGTICALMLLNINISFIIPYHKILMFESVDNAFYFRYPQGRIMYKKDFEDASFIYGANVYKSEKNHSYPGNFSLYVKEGKKWKIKQSGEENVKNKICIKDKKNGKRYDIYKLSTDDGKINGIYITNFLANSSLSANTKITDAYNTKYEGIEGLDSNAGKFSTYMFFGILTKEITNDYYINIDGTKYILSDYHAKCSFK